MAIVLDINIIPSVFNPKDSKFDEFKPILNFLDDLSVDSSIVIGGTTYLNELAKLNTYLKIIKLYKDRGKVRNINNTMVDQYEIHLSNKFNESDFDDKHIVSLIEISGCKLFASLDMRSYKYVKEIGCYSCSTNRPKIYSGKRNISLLNKKYLSNLKNIVV